MIDELSQKLGYIFLKPALLNVALTHRSKSGEHNERLEFLGDAVVNFVVAELLYQQFPKASEGDLTRWRSTLVNRETLALLAKDFDLGRYVFLGPGELRSGGHERMSILSCTMEAIIGAMYLDGNFVDSKKNIARWYEPYIKRLSSAASHKDPKTILQEYLQSHKYSLPLYEVTNTEGQAHQQLFTISCTVANLKKKTFGKGTSRRRAEQEAAALMLEKLNK